MTTNEVVDHLFEIYGFSYPKDTMDLGQLHTALWRTGKYDKGLYGQSPVARVAEYILRQLRPDWAIVEVRDRNWDDGAKQHDPERFRKGVPVRVVLKRRNDPSRPGVIYDTYIGESEISPIKGIIGQPGDNHQPRERWLAYVEELAKL